MSTTSSMSVHECKFSDCGRQFLDVALLEEHAEAVHSFNDIESLLREHLREAYGSNGAPMTGAGRTYVWVTDVSTDWVVFTVETDSECQLYKADYSIDESNNVTLGTPAEVVRRTVYDPVPAKSSAASLEVAAAKAAEAMTASQQTVYKKMRAQGMPHAAAMKVAKKAKD